MHGADWMPSLLSHVVGTTDGWKTLIPKVRLYIIMRKRRVPPPPQFPCEQLGFAKTGSGQTQGKLHPKRGGVLFFFFFFFFSHVRIHRMSPRTSSVMAWTSGR